MMGSDAGVLPKCFRHLNHISGDIVETDIASGDNPAEGGLSGGSSGSDWPPRCFDTHKFKQTHFCEKECACFCNGMNSLHFLREFILLNRDSFVKASKGDEGKL